MTFLPKFAVQRPIFTVMLFLSVLIFGVITVRMLPVEMMPNISFGHITIYIDVRGGIPASEVEKRIAKPVEEAVGSVSHLKNILTISKEGNAMIILEFEPGIDMDFAALEVREKFNRVRNKLPREVEKPIIAKYEYTDVPIMILAVTSTRRTPEEIRKIVDEKIKDTLQRVEGVARVEVAGGREGKILIEVDKNRLESFVLPINMIVDKINVNNVNLLAGEIKRSEDKYLIRTIGEFEKLEDIKNLAVTVSEQGAAIRVKDFAQVKDSYLDPTAFSRVNTEPSVSLYIQKESLANTVKVAGLVTEAVKDLQSELDNDIEMAFTLNQANYVRAAVNVVRQSLFLGALLAIAVLFLFLKDIALILVIAVSIPMSVMLTFPSMYFFSRYFPGLSLNIMTLSGLAMGVGLLVDNTIVVIENIYKKAEHMFHFHRDSQGNPLPLSARTQKGISAQGASEMVLAMFASTLTTVAVFLPMCFANPSISLLTSGFAFTLCFALGASLLCALILVPMLVSRLRIRPQGRLNADFYKNALTACVKFRYLVVVGVLVASIAIVHQAKKLEHEFIGIAEQNKFTVFIEMPTGTRIDVTNDIVKKVENHVARIPEVKTVTAKVEPWSSKLYVELYPLAQRRISSAEIIANIRPFTEKLKPAFIYFEEEEEVGTKEIILEIFGYDYEVLKNLAVQIGQKIQSIPQFTDAKIRMREGRPEMHIEINKAQAALLGFSVQDIALALHTQLRGLVATQYRGNRGPILRVAEGSDRPARLQFMIARPGLEKEEAKETETIVRLEEKFRKSFEDLKRTTLVSPDGEIIYLSQIAEFSYDIGPSEIWRKNKARMVQVSANTGGLALGSAAERVHEVLSDLALPKDYFWQIGGNYEKMQRNQQDIVYVLLISFALVYMILASLFESFSQPFIILMTVPLAAMGAIIVLRLTGKPVGFGVYIGGLILLGIVVNNAIFLVDRINFLKKKKGNAFSIDKIVVSASADRLRPIIITSLTTISSMIFMVALKSEFSNLTSPIGLIVISGMSVATPLTLFAIPSLYLIFEDIKRLF